MNPDETVMFIRYVTPLSSVHSVEKQNQFSARHHTPYWIQQRQLFLNLNGEYTLREYIVSEFFPLKYFLLFAVLIYYPCFRYKIAILAPQEYLVSQENV